MINRTEIIPAGERLAESLKSNKEDDLEWIFKNKPDVLTHTKLLLDFELKKAQVDTETIMEQACLLCPEHDKQLVKKHMNQWLTHLIEGKEYPDADKLSDQPAIRERLKQKSEKLVQIYQNSILVVQAIDKIKIQTKTQVEKEHDNFNREQSGGCVLF